MSDSIDAEPAERTRRARLLDALYRQYASHLFRVIRGQKVNREEAREILQETYCRLQQVPQIDAIQSHSGYLFRTAINLTRDRKRQRRRECPNAEPGEPAIADAAELPSEAPTAYRVLKAQQELAIIREAILELNPTCRQVFVMHRFENATYPEIAERFGLSVSMIEKHVSQALAHLRARLGAAELRVSTTRQPGAER